jgi:phosphogluconate dehydratase
VLRVEQDVAEWARRTHASAPVESPAGYGLQLFALQRRMVGPADQGATTLEWED